MPFRWLAVALLLAITVGGCTAAAAPVSPRSTSAQQTTPAGTPTGDPVTRAEATGAGPGRLVDVQVDRRADTDRIVFAFDGGLPGYTVEYVPLAEVDGAGGTETPAGSIALVVELTPASSAGYSGDDRIYIAPSETASGVVEELVLATRGGARLVWALGMRERVPFTVSRYSASSQLIINLSHED